MDANIPLSDILSFLEDLKTSREVLRQQFQPIREEIINRFRDTSERIAATDDVNTLQKLDAFEKFLKSISEHFDLLYIFIDRTTGSIETIDTSYWSCVFNHEKLKQENLFLRDTVEGLQKQRDLVVSSWSAERRKWNQDRVLNKVA